MHDFVESPVFSSSTAHASYRVKEKAYFALRKQKTRDSHIRDVSNWSEEILADVLQRWRNVYAKRSYATWGREGNIGVWRERNCLSDFSFIDLFAAGLFALSLVQCTSALVLCSFQGLSLHDCWDEWLPIPEAPAGVHCERVRCLQGGTPQHHRRLHGNQVQGDPLVWQKRERAATD